MPFICVVSKFVRDKMSFYAATKQWLSNVIALTVHLVFNCFLKRLGKFLFSFYVANSAQILT